MSGNWNWTVPNHCHQCGKEIYASKAYWGYKKYIYPKGDKREIMFCSWHCLRAFEKSQTEVKAHV